MNIILCGVGGQGVLFIAQALTNGFLENGEIATSSETHGMAQRGGSVITHVRTGDHANSHLVPTGQCDAMIAMEISEALRYKCYLSENSHVFINDYEVYPLLVNLKKQKYPERQAMLDELAKITKNLHIVPATQLAIDNFNKPIMANVIMLGALSTVLPFSLETLKKTIADISPDRFRDSNIEALRVGSEK